MQIVLHKLSNERHALELIRDSGARELVECETRSYLMHDLLHYAVELEGGIDSGFWGRLEQGKTLQHMNDRTGRELAGEMPELMAIERVVGGLSAVTKGRPASEIVRGLCEYARALNETPPAWLSEALVVRVQARMQGLIGQWKATRYGEAMTLPWPGAGP